MSDPVSILATNAVSFDQVLCQKDYLSIICCFCTLKEIVLSISSISSFHYKFINDAAQKKLITLLSNKHFDFLDTKISIEYNSNNNSDKNVSVCQQISQFIKRIDDNFRKTVSVGQIMLKYTGKRRRKAQDRIIKVTFEKNDINDNPSAVRWGTGSRYIEWKDIEYIAYGIWTPVFDCRRDQLKPDGNNEEKELDELKCFSVVGKTQILDVQAYSENVAKLWVDALRHLKHQTKTQSDKLAKIGFESGNLPGSKKTKAENLRTERHKQLQALQQDLFVMTREAVFRTLEDERMWTIDDELKSIFDAQGMHEHASRQNIPWRQWNQWIRQEIIGYLRQKQRNGTPILPLYAYGMNVRQQQADQVQQGQSQAQPQQQLRYDLQQPQQRYPLPSQPVSIQPQIDQNPNQDQECLIM